MPHISIPTLMSPSKEAISATSAINTASNALTNTITNAPPAQLATTSGSNTPPDATTTASKAPTQPEISRASTSSLPLPVPAGPATSAANSALELRISATNARITTIFWTIRLSARLLLPVLCARMLHMLLMDVRLQIHTVGQRIARFSSILRLIELVRGRVMDRLIINTCSLLKMLR